MLASAYSITDVESGFFRMIYAKNYAGRSVFKRLLVGFDRRSQRQLGGDFAFVFEQINFLNVKLCNPG